MNATQVDRRDSAGDARTDDGWRQRRPGRCKMFKPAQIAYGASVFDCILLDASPEGAQVHLVRPPANLPELVTLRLPGGESRSVRRCWNRGAHIGFEVVGPPLTL